MGEIPVLIFNTIIHIFIFLVFFRFLTQLAMVNPYNPVVFSLAKATQFVDVFSRIFPTLGKGRINLAALVLLVLLCLFQNFGEPYLQGVPPDSASFLLVYTFITMTLSLLDVCWYLIIGSIILSWVRLLSHINSPLFEVVDALAEPLLAPFRRLLPHLGGIDFSPLLALLALRIAEIVMNEVAVSLLSGF